VNERFSRSEMKRLRAWARSPEPSACRTHARMAIAESTGRGVRLSVDDLEALIAHDDAVATAQANLAAGDYGLPVPGAPGETE